MNAAALATTLLDVVLPVFLIAAVGFLTRRFLAIEPWALARLALYVLVPALLFRSLYATQLAEDELLRIAAFVALLTLAMIVIGFVGSRLMAVSRSEASGLTLSVAFLNAANYGLPVNLFAFGPAGFDRAVIFAACESILTFSLAVFIAARGRLEWRRALLPIVQIPVLWAGAAALLLRWNAVTLPLPVERAMNVLADGTIPAVILLLGMQIAGMRLGHLRPPTFAAAAARLLLSPLIGLGLVALLQPSPLTARVLILEAAMPTAVNATLIAAEFRSEPELVSSVTLITTLASLVTVAGWVAYLQGM